MGKSWSSVIGKCSIVFLIAAIFLAQSGVPSVSAAPAGTALQFNGTNQYATFGAASGLAALGAQTFTLELWFMRTGAGATTSTGTGGVTAAIPLIAKGRGEGENSNIDMNYFLGIDSATGVLVADFEECAPAMAGCPAGGTAGLNHPVTGVTVIQNNLWYHAAVTYDGRFWNLYLNGALERTLDVGATRYPRWDSIQHASIGTAMTSAGAAAGFFAGVIDEARIWNVAQTQAAIQSTMYQEVTTGAGLIGRWGMNEGSGVSIADSTTPAQNGTLVGTPLWVPGFEMTLPDALKLGANNGYVQFANSAALNTATFTLETWFRRDGAGTSTTTGTGGTTVIPLISKGTAEAENANADVNYILGINPTGNLLCADFEEAASGASPSLNHPICGTTAITTGTWYHVAATYDGNQWVIYLNGVEEARLVVGRPANAVNIAPAALGTSIQTNGTTRQGYFNGTLDEVRIWNYARSAAQIQSNLNAKISVAQAGLLGRWSLDEASGNIARSTAGVAIDGTIPVGTGFLWVPGAPFNVTIPAPAAPSGLNATASTSANINLTWTDNSNSETGFEIERGTNVAGPFSPLSSVGMNVTSTSDGTVSPLTQYCYRVRAVNAGFQSAYSNVSCATTPAQGGEALQLGSANAYVIFPTSGGLNTPTYTIETWFRRDGTGASTTTGIGGTFIEPLIAKGTAEAEIANADINYIFGINPTGNLLCADFEEAGSGSAPGQNHPVCGTTSIQNGVWYHAAATYDGTTWHLYLNGMPEASLTVGEPANNVNISPASLGTSIQSDGATTQGFFNGTMEEARIWNYARTPAEILSTVNSQITTAQSGLIARWGMNQNTGAAVNGSAGTSVNGTITGTGYNWVTPGAPFNINFSIPTAPSGLNATTSFAYRVDLTWTDNSSNEVSFEIERGSNAGGPFSLVGTTGLNTAAFADSNVLPLTQYCYRVRAVNAGGPSGYSNVSCATTLAESGAALQLGNSDAFAKFTNSASLNTPTFTIETWFRRDGAGVGTDTGTGGIASLIPLIAKGTSESENDFADINYILGIDTATNTICADFEEASSGAAPSQNHPVCGTTPIVNGTWYHVAATYDGTTWNVYLNGVLDATLVVGQPANAVSISPVSLGTSIESNGNVTGGYFNGSMDEVRIWNSARTLGEIQGTINSQLSAAQPGLIARWSLNEDAGNMVHATAGTAVNGTMFGAGYSWITPGAPFNIVLTAPADPSGLTATAASAYQINLTWADNSNNETSFEVERGSAAAGPFSPLMTLGQNVTSTSDTGVFPVTQYCYRVRAVNAVGPSGYSNVSCVTTLAENASALDFGTNRAYVTFGDANSLDLGQFTLEGWFRRDGTGIPNTTGTGGIANAVPLISNGSPEAENANADVNYILCINDTTDTLCADFEEAQTGGTPGLNHPATGVTPIVNGQWYHAAVTYDGTTLRLYLNGVLESQQVIGQPANTANISSTALATMLTTTGVANGAFDGAMDEVRIWNYSRTENEIRTTINTQITTPQSGLVARWGLNEGSGTTVGGTAGTVVNGTVTGTGYSWITPGAPFNITFNAAPNMPVLVSPADNSTGVSTSPTLSVDVSDPEGDNLTVQFYGRPVGAAAGPDFSIIAIPDTQYYTSSLNGGLPAMANSQTQWVVDNLAAYNIQFVSQLGDCTEHGDQFIIEWQNADAYFDIIENPITTGLTYGMPYGIAPGNHDQTPIGNPTGTTLYNQFFGEARFAGRDYYGGHYGTDNDNHYELFSASGLDFIVVHLEYDTAANPAVLAWADNLLQTYSTRHAIVVTHWLINTGFNASFGAQGQAIYDTLKDNPNLFLMLGGHVPGEGQRTDTFSGNTVYSLLSDYQGRTNGGNGWMRIITISPASGNIQVRTYSPWLNQWETDADSQFNLPINFTNSFQLIGTDTAPSGGTASVTWPGLTEGTEYEWYAVVSDASHSTTGDTWSFTTDRLPVAQPDTYTATEDTPLNVPANGVLGNDTDGDNDPLTAIKDTDPAHGTVTLNADGSFAYTPALNYCGPDSFTYHASDGVGNSNIVTVTINVDCVNDPPVITGQAPLTTSEDTSLTLALANLTVTDPDNTYPTGFTLTVQPGVNYTVAGSTITPTLNFTGILTVPVTVNDGSLNSAPFNLSVTVSPVNDPPTTSGIANITVDEDAANTVINLWTSFADVEDADSALTYTVTGNTNAALFTSVNVTGGQNLVLDYAPDQFGSAQITVRAADTGLPSLFVETIFTVTVNPINDPPTTAGIANVNVAEDAPNTTVDLWASFADSEDADSALTYTVTGNTNAALFTSVNVTGGQNLVLDYAPDQFGSTQITVRAADTGIPSLFVETTFTVTVLPVNDPPVITGQTPLSTPEETSLTLALANLTVTDPDNTYPTGFTLTVQAGANYTFVGSTITPALNFNGVLTVPVIVNDGANDSAVFDLSVTVTPVNDLPTTSGILDVTENEDAPNTIINLWNSFADVEDADSALTYTVTNNTNAGLFTSVNVTGGQNLVLDYAPNQSGNAQITIRATDTGNQYVETTFTVTVNPVNDPPTTSGIANVSVSEDAPDTTIDLWLSFADVEDADSALTYTVTNNTNAGLFTSVNVTGGQNLVLDYAPNQSGNAQITIRATDTGNQFVETILNVTVIPVNDPPTDIGISNGTVAEGLPAGTPVGNFTTTDPDSGDTFTYTFCGGTDDGSFQIVGDELQTNAVLDADIQNTFVVCIQSDDAGGQNTQHTFNITLTNVNEAPVITLQAASKNVAESSPLFFNNANSTLITVNDPDAGGGSLQVTLTVTQGLLTLNSINGLTITAPADGSGDASITFRGTLPDINIAMNGMRYDPAPGYNGGDTLQIDVDDLGNTGSGGSRTASGNMAFTVTAAPPKVTDNGINTFADTGDGVLSESEIVTVGITRFIITFDQDVSNPAGNNGLDDVTNPANYMLVHDNGDDFQTTSCLDRADPRDSAIAIDSVSYSNGSGAGPFVATVDVNGGVPLALGNYRLFICGTTSITDLFGVELAGDGVNAGTDKTRSFTVVINNGGGGTGSGSGSGELAKAEQPLTVTALPATGFAPGRVTVLPGQPKELGYSDLGDLWIEIPSLGVKSSIVGVPMLEEGAWDVTWLGDNVGWLNGTAFPSWEGNSVITAHVTNASGLSGPFTNLKKLKYGDQVIIHAYGQKYIFEVRISRAVSPIATTFAFEHLEDHSYLTLITCQVYLPKSDKYMFRRVVRAVLIGVEAEE